MDFYSPNFGIYRTENWTLPPLQTILESNFNCTFDKKIQHTQNEYDLFTELSLKFVVFC